MTNEEIIESVIQRAIELINQQGHAGINYALTQCNQPSDINKAEGIAAKMQETGKFLIQFTLNKSDVFVIRNPNYE
jgi:hypothetical protein